MTCVEIRDGSTLFEQAFAIHRQIPEFDIQSTAQEQLHERIRSAKQPLILVANIDDQPAGYLMGYERNGSFYVWLAGVLPAYRRHGVLAQLMTRTEQWARTANYTSLTIKTRNRFKSMLLFLLSRDFKIVDVDKRESPDSHRLLLEKTLSAV
jgi:GNAT superfamily N-acetyltransferase